MGWFISTRQQSSRRSAPTDGWALRAEDIGTEWLNVGGGGRLERLLKQRQGMPSPFGRRLGAGSRHAARVGCWGGLMRSGGGSGVGGLHVPCLGARSGGLRPPWQGMPSQWGKLPVLWVCCCFLLVAVAWPDPGAQQWCAGGFSSPTQSSPIKQRTSTVLHCGVMLPKGLGSSSFPPDPFLHLLPLCLQRAFRCYSDAFRYATSS